MLKGFAKFRMFKSEKMFDVAELQEKEPELFEDLCKDYPTEEKNIMICVGEEKRHKLHKRGVL